MAEPALIVFEGPENAGKTSVLGLLRNAMPASCCFLPEAAAEVGQSFPLGTAGTIGSEVALMSITAISMWRASSLVAEGATVFLDRCWLSNVSYARVRARLDRSLQMGAGLHEVQAQVLERMFFPIIKRMSVFFFDVSPVNTLSRWESRIEKPTNHVPSLNWLSESAVELDRVLQEFSIRFPEARIQRIDADGSVDKVFQSIESMLASR